MKIILALIVLFVPTAGVMGQPKPKLELKIEQSAKSLKGGGNLSFTLRIHNVGDTKATKLIVVSDPIGQVEITSIRSNKGNCKTQELGKTPRMRCVFGFLDSGRSVSINGLFKVLDFGSPKPNPNVEASTRVLMAEIQKMSGMDPNNLPNIDTSTLLASFWFSFDEDLNPPNNFIDLRAKLLPRAERNPQMTKAPGH